MTPQQEEEKTMAEHDDASTEFHELITEWQRELASVCTERFGEFFDDPQPTPRATTIIPRQRLREFTLDVSGVWGALLFHAQLRGLITPAEAERELEVLRDFAQTWTVNEHGNVSPYPREIPRRENSGN